MLGPTPSKQENAATGRDKAGKSKEAASKAQTNTHNTGDNQKLLSTAPFVLLQAGGLLPDGCTVPSMWKPLIDFIAQTTQLLFILGVVVLMLGYVVSGLYWIVAGPDGKRRALQWVKHVTIGGLILVLARPAAAYIIQSFSMIPCGGG